MKRLVAAASIAGGMWLGLSAPAGAIVIVDGAEATVGNPNERVGVEVTADLWPASRTGLLACLADSLFIPCIAESGRS